MNVLIISLDRGLLGDNPLGDVIERHRTYGKYVDRIDIIVFAVREKKKNNISENVTVYSTQTKSKIFVPLLALDMGKKLFFQEKYDLIVTQDPFITGFIGLQLKKKFGAKLLVHLHGDFFKNPLWIRENWKNRFYLPLAKYIVNCANAIRVMSFAQKEKLLAMNISEEKIEVISTPVNIERFENYNNEKAISALTNRIKVQGLEKIILMVGRKDKVKDFPTLFKAMRIVMEKNPKAGLWLVGNYQEDEIDQIDVLEPKRRVIISNRVDSVNLPAYYKLCDVVVLSSTSESFGKVLVEANACGKPVVSTATSGAREIIKDGINGFIVPIKDSDALAEKITYLLRNPEIAKKMGQDGKTLMYEKFDGKKNTRRIIEFWKKIVAKS